jgi:Rab GDP dissociation inhibitor
VQLFKKYGNFQAGTEPWKAYGRPADWNIDLVPKFLMSSGELTNILVSTDVTRYLEFKQVAGSYVQQNSGAKATVAKVPSDAGEALRSPLMGIFEKRRMKSFIEWIGTFDINDAATHKGKRWDTFILAPDFGLIDIGHGLIRVQVSTSPPLP